MHGGVTYGDESHSYESHSYENYGYESDDGRWMPFAYLSFHDDEKTGDRKTDDRVANY